MTVIYCDLCGKALTKGDAGNSVTVRTDVSRVSISEFRADSCDWCARQLIDYVKSGPWKGASQK